jgi:hypothetical protein
MILDRPARPGGRQPGPLRSPLNTKESTETIGEDDWLMRPGDHGRTVIMAVPPTAHQVGDVASYHLQRSDVGEGTAWSSSSRSATASICSAKSHHPHQHAQSSDAPFHGPAALKPRSPWPARLGSHTPSGARRSSASPAHAPLLSIAGRDAARCRRGTGSQAVPPGCLQLRAR